MNHDVLFMWTMKMMDPAFKTFDTRNGFLSLWVEDSDHMGKQKCSASWPRVQLFHSRFSIKASVQPQ